MTQHAQTVPQRRNARPPKPPGKPPKHPENAQDWFEGYRKLWVLVCQQLKVDPDGKYPRLGEGGMGVAYDLGDGRVLKLSKDASEASSMEALKLKPSPDFVKVYDVLRAHPKDQPPEKDRFAVVMEKLDPPAPWMRAYCSAMWHWRAKARDDFAFMRESDARAFQALMEDEDFVYEDIAEKAGGFKRIKFNDLEFIRDRLESHVSESQLQFMSKWFVRVCRHLDKMGIKFRDLHGNNVMSRNGKPVVIDLGVSVAESPAGVPMVEGALVDAAPSQWKESDVPQRAPTPFAKAPEVWVRLATRLGLDPEAPVTQRFPVIGGRRRYHHRPLSTWDVGDGKYLTLTTDGTEAGVWNRVKSHPSPVLPTIYDVLSLRVGDHPLWAILHEPLTYPVPQAWNDFVSAFFQWRAHSKRALHHTTPADLKEFLTYLVKPGVGDKTTLKKDRVDRVLPEALREQRKAEADSMRTSLMRGADLEGMIAWAKAVLAYLKDHDVAFEDLDTSNLGLTKDGRVVVVNLAESAPKVVTPESLDGSTFGTAESPLDTARALDVLFSGGKNTEMKDYRILDPERKYLLQLAYDHEPLRLTLKWMAKMGPRPTDEEVEWARNYVRENAEASGGAFGDLWGMLDALT